ncbi:MAG: hypothetical protein ACOCXQ_01655 [Patescibacteria group bacterium]
MYVIKKLVSAFIASLVFFHWASLHQPAQAQTSCTLYELSEACGQVDGSRVCDAPSPTPTPTPEPAKPWIKMRSASFYSENLYISAGNNYYVPTNPDPFREVGEEVAGEDASVTDQGDPHLMAEDTTTVTVNGQSRKAFEPGVARVDDTNFDVERINEKGWALIGQGSRSVDFTPEQFLAYARNRKDNVILTGEVTKLGAIENKKVNIYDPEAAGDVNDTISAGATALNKSPYVLVVDGNLTITENINLDGSRNIAIIVTGELTFEEDVTVANALFVTNNLALPGTLGSGTYGLRIVGNLIVMNGMEQISIQRSRTNDNKPTVFVVQSIRMYMELLPYFSTANYEWQSLQ